MQRAAGNLATSLGEIAAFEELVAGRLCCALGLLAHPKVRERLGDSAQPAEDVARWLRAHRGLVANEPAVRDLDDCHTRLSTLLANYEGREENEAFLGAVARETQKVYRSMESLLGQLGEVEFPFEHGKDHLSVAQHLLPDGPSDPDHPGAVEQDSRALLERTAALHDRILSALAAAAEPAEKLFGLERSQPAEAEGDAGA